MKEWARSFYKSKAWKECRTSYIAKREALDGGLCEICRENPGFIVHHKRNLTPQNISDPEIALNHSNLEYVCKPCHDKAHGYCGKTEWETRFSFDSSGNPIPKTG